MTDDTNSVVLTFSGSNSGSISVAPNASAMGSSCSRYCALCEARFSIDAVSELGEPEVNVGRT